MMKSLQNNFEVVYRDLLNSIHNYAESGMSKDDLKYINAYLAASIHALIDYTERFMKDDDYIMAFKYVNNTIKHVNGFITHSEVAGGVSFPVEFPLCIDKIRVIWKSYAELNVNKEAQKESYTNLLAGREIIETLKPFAEKIQMGYQNNRNI